MAPLPTYLSLAEFSALSGLSVTTLRRRIKDGSLPYRQLGGRRHRLLIPRDALETLNQPVDSSCGPCQPDEERNGPTQHISAAPHELPGPRPRWTQQLNT
jgi:hypothetical protein